MRIASKKINNILKIDGREISFDEVVNNFDKIDLPPYYLSALLFIKDWILGKETFQFTSSGSTGEPKELVLTRQQMIRSAEGTAKALDLSGFKTSLVCLNANYIAGRMMIVRSLEYDLLMTIVEPSSNPIAPFGGNIAFDFAALVPLQLENILDKLPVVHPVFNHFKAIIVGGAPVSSRLVSLISEVEVPVYATYGMTETVSHIALQRLNGSQKQDFFTVLDGVSIQSDERGCLSVKSPATNDSWIMTNDIVEILDDKRFRFLGRYDHVINSGGVKVHPERVEVEVEKIFSILGIHRRFFISGLPDERLGMKVCLIIEGEKLESATEETFFENIKTQVELYHAPREIIYLNEFKETPTGKVDRRKSILSLTR